MENNQTNQKLLAEIDRLKKELKKKKKYGLVWEDKPEDVVEMCKEKLPVLKEVKSKEIITDKNKPVNLLIEGDNYHALSVLNYTHKGKIDVIYIDPPYNTGNKDFIYNDSFIEKDDSFRHSKWLSFMNKRLVLAKNTLSSNGLIFISIDENEYANLKSLCDLIFGENNLVNSFVWINNLKGRQISGLGAAGTHEYILCYAKNSNNISEFYGSAQFLKAIMPTTYKGFNYQTKNDKEGNYVIKNELYNSNSIFNELTRPNLVFDIYYNPTNGDVICEDVSNKNLHKGYQKISPKINNSGRAKYHAWRWSKKKIINETNDLEFVDTANGYKIYTKIRDLDKTIVKDVITDINTSTGSQDINNIFSKGTFNYPKPVDLIKFIIMLCGNKDCMTLDFFAGSGTTAQAVLDLNKKDNGNRKFILCTDNQDNNGSGLKIAEDICYPRVKKVIQGYKKNGSGEKVGGLGGNLKYFKTDFVDYKQATDKNKIRLTEEAIEMLCVKEGTFEEVENRVGYKIFKNSAHYAGIIFDQLAIKEFKKAI